MATRPAEPCSAHSRASGNPETSRWALGPRFRADQRTGNGCSLRRARPLLGTIVEIAVEGGARSIMELAVDQAFETIATVHARMSFHDPASDVGRLNRRAQFGPISVHSWTFEVLSLAAELHQRSRGAFDIGVAPVLQKLGMLPVDTNAPFYSAKPSGGSIELLADNRVFFRHAGVRIDLGGIAKGFAVDRAVEILQRHGLGGLVNAGGDLRVFGPNAHAITIRDPRSPGQSMCRVGLRDKALASTGGSFDPFGSARIGSCATIDPQRSAPVDAIRGATVMASCCVVADALTKVVMIAAEGAAPLLDHFAAAALFMRDDGEIRVTSDWPDLVDLAA